MGKIAKCLVSIIRIKIRHMHRTMSYVYDANFGMSAYSRGKLHNYGLLNVCADKTCFHRPICMQSHITQLSQQLLSYCGHTYLYDFSLLSNKMLYRVS